MFKKIRPSRQPRPALKVQTHIKAGPHFFSISRVVLDRTVDDGCGSSMRIIVGRDSK